MLLDTTEIAIFVALGLLFAVGVVVLARWSQKSAAHIAAYALIAVAFLYVGFAFRSEDPKFWLGFEMTGVAVFGSLAGMSLIGSPWFVALGFLLHPAWLYQFHYIGTGAAFAPATFVVATMAFDAALALYVIVMNIFGARGTKAASAPAPQVAARSRSREKTGAK
jgi:hypothetical protein